MSNSNAISILFNEFEEFVTTLSLSSIRLDGVYLCAVKAALAKNYELNCFVTYTKEIATSWHEASSANLGS